MQAESQEMNSGFYVKSSEGSESIEIVEKEMTNEFKQQVCLPYFKDLYKVHRWSRGRTYPRAQIGLQKESTRSCSWT